MAAVTICSDLEPKAKIDSLSESSVFIYFFTKMEMVRDYFLGSKITANGDCSHEVKRCLLL